MAKETESGLRKMQFSKTLRGYSCEEVDAYFAHVNDRYVAVVRECSELKKKMAVVAAGQNEFREDALREKAKIAAEAEALLAEKKTAAETLISDAEQKAAMILSKAEVAAAGILKQAEEEAEALRQKNVAELEKCKDAERKLRSHNNTADRLVQEIDSFREKVYAMYASHIEALEQLAQITDDFYQVKEGLTSDGSLGVPAAGDETAAGDEIYEPVVEEDTTFVEEPIANTDPMTDETDDALLRIDWQEHRQKKATRETKEAEEMAGKTLWEVAQDAHVAAEKTDPVDLPAELFQSEENQTNIPEANEDISDAYIPNEDIPNEDIPNEDIPNEDIWEDPVFEEVAEPAPSPTPAEEPEPHWEEEQLQEPDAITEEEPEGDLLMDLERDLLSAYAKGGVHGAEDAVDAFDLESLIAEEEPAENEADTEEDFLSGIASEYLSHPTTPVEPAEENTATDITSTNADDLDELLDDEQSHDVSLTGEFDKIFSSKKSAAYVNEVSRQPLVEAKKPEKPKKHK